MNPLILIEKLINEHGSASILGERLHLLKDELAKVVKERAQLNKKCADLKKEVTDLRQQLSQAIVPDQYIEHLNVLFKRDTSGRYTPTPFCPECKRPLWNTGPHIFPWACSRDGCGFSNNIHEDLDQVAKQLNERTP